MELSRTSTRLFFLAAMQVFYAMYSAFERDWLNLIISLTSFFVMLHAFAMIENALDETRPKGYMEEILNEAN